MTVFTDWLAALERAGRLLNIDEPIWPGLPWAVEFAFPADYSGDAFAMSIASAPDGASEVNDVTLGTPTYANLRTTILASLNAAQTGERNPDADADGNQVVTMYYVLKRTPSGGGEYPILGGTVTVVGRPDVD